MQLFFLYVIYFLLQLFYSFIRMLRCHHCLCWCIVLHWYQSLLLQSQRLVLVRQNLFLVSQSLSLLLQLMSFGHEHSFVRYFVVHLLGLLLNLQLMLLQIQLRLRRKLIVCLCKLYNVNVVFLRLLKLFCYKILLLFYRLSI